MERVNNIFTVDSVIEANGYCFVTGKYLIPTGLSFEKGDILTEDKYNGHQIYVVFATKDEKGNDCLTLYTKSIHSNIEKSLDVIIPGLNLFKIED